MPNDGSPDDPHNLERFVRAQMSEYERAVTELREGRKQTHWMWFIFPQIAGLGHSLMSQRYAIKDEAEARAYMAHAILGPRLLECASIVAALMGKTAYDIFGSPDDMKLHSSATLFGQVSTSPVFYQIIDKYFDGKPDHNTIALLSMNRR
jgi:uncharacterized protein (DUF1810 family)